MDYGKIALSKIEDLQNYIQKSNNSRSPFNILLFDKNSSVTFTDVYTFSQSFKCLSQGSIAIDVVFNIDNPQDGLALCKAELNGAEADSKSITTGAGKGQYTLNFLLDTVITDYTFVFTVTYSDSISRIIKNLSVRVTGDIQSLNDSCKIVVSDEGNYTKAVYNDKDFIYYNLVSGENLILSKKFVYRGDYSFCACRHNSTEVKYDVFFSILTRVNCLCMLWHTTLVSAITEC